MPTLQARPLDETQVLKNETRAVGLRHVSDIEPGITRRRAGKGFSYRAPDGSLITDRSERQRIARIAIPPAWRDVWISPIPDGYLQATGRDARGRKQYRYHSEWRALRESTKFDRILVFGRALPGIRERVLADMARPRLDQRKVVATVVRLLETTLIRIGNDEYARQNDSYGLTTFENRHIDLEGSTLRFAFRGKGGKQHEVALRDPRVARAVRRIQELPGQQLFQYRDEEGRPRGIDSAEVNAYLNDIAGEDFTAKDFRTWSGTVLAALALLEFEAFDSKTAAQRNIRRAIERVAQRLGNTPTVCRKSYVHPEIIEAYVDGTLLEQLKREVERELREELAGLMPEEVAVLALLQERLAKDLGDRA